LAFITFFFTHILNAMTDHASTDAPLRLHVGGEQVKEGWKILNVQPHPGIVDFVGDCVDLSRFADNSVAELYASHVYEHLAYGGDVLLRAWKEVHRVLVPGGRFLFGVPDLTTLCRLFLEPKLDISQRFHVMRMIYGGQVDEHDFHRVGLTEEFAYSFLRRAGFSDAKRVASFGLFDDTSNLQFLGVPISLNIEAVK
jgi:predicted SAM-dependent methyltransferase